MVMRSTIWLEFSIPNGAKANLGPISRNSPLVGSGIFLHADKLVLERGPWVDFINLDNFSTLVLIWFNNPFEKIN